MNTHVIWGWGRGYVFWSAIVFIPGALMSLFKKTFLQIFYLLFTKSMEFLNIKNYSTYQINAIYLNSYSINLTSNVHKSCRINLIMCFEDARFSQMNITATDYAINMAFEKKISVGFYIFMYHMTSPLGVILRHSLKSINH